MILIDTPVNVFDADSVRAHLSRLEAHRDEIAWPEESIAFWRRKLAEIEARARGAERPADGPDGSGPSLPETPGPRPISLENPFDSVQRN